MKFCITHQVKTVSRGKNQQKIEKQTKSPELKRKKQEQKKEKAPEKKLKKTNLVAIEIPSNYLLRKPNLYS